MFGLLKKGTATRGPPPLFGAKPSDMDRFFNDQNLERLRSLASIATTEAEREILLGLLAEERLRFIELPEGQNDAA